MGRQSSLWRTLALVEGVPPKSSLGAAAATAYYVSRKNDLEFANVEAIIPIGYLGETIVHAWLSFIGRIEPMEWGKSTYTVLPVPGEIAQALKVLEAKRVDVELNDHSFNMALTKSPAILGTFVYTGKTVLHAAGIAPGEEVDVRLRKADPDLVELPNDVMLAIRDADLSSAWSALTPGMRRGHLHTINTAKRAETHVKRITQLVAALRE